MVFGKSDCNDRAGCTASILKRSNVAKTLGWTLECHPFMSEHFRILTSRRQYIGESSAVILKTLHESDASAATGFQLKCRALEPHGARGGKFGSGGGRRQHYGKN